MIFSQQLEKIEVEQEIIPYETITKDASQGATDTKNRVIQQGQDGLKEVTYKVKYQNDTEIEKNKNRAFSIGRNTDIDSAEIFKEKIVKLPQDKVPIIIAGGSFNSKGRETVITERGKELLKELIEKLDSEKAYFVIGHKMQGYEKSIFYFSI